ncbi:MAG: hypothetical protein K0U72_08895 [Gammaproteobacteria bacterium]|nr:hypothetical protein [Gammaproteobacteria bacterium]
MNKILTTAILAGGLLLLDSPEAAAHTVVKNKHRPPAQHYVDHRDRDGYRGQQYRRDYYDRNARHGRVGKMPRWLKKKKSFRRWYKETPLRKSRRLTWNQLFEIYRWERAYFRYHRH